MGIFDGKVAILTGAGRGLPSPGEDDEART
jgi:hypothetical protein